MPTAPKIAEVQNEIDRLSQATGSVEDLMWEVVRLLHDRMLKYNWVGFYMLEEKPVNRPAAHAGAGAVSGGHDAAYAHSLESGYLRGRSFVRQNVVVDDVSLDERYLACSTETKSEIVVPIFVRGKVVGELDIDSHFPAAFGDQDRGWWSTAPLWKWKAGNSKQVSG